MRQHETVIGGRLSFRITLIDRIKWFGSCSDFLGLKVGGTRRTDRYRASLRPTKRLVLDPPVNMPCQAIPSPRSVARRNGRPGSRQRGNDPDPRGEVYPALLDGVGIEARPIAADSEYGGCLFLEVAAGSLQEAALAGGIEA